MPRISIKKSLVLDCEPTLNWPRSPAKLLSQAGMNGILGTGCDKVQSSQREDEFSPNGGVEFEQSDRDNRHIPEIQNAARWLAPTCCTQPRPI